MKKRRIELIVTLSLLVGCVFFTSAAYLKQADQAETKPEAKPIIKAFPPQYSTKFDGAQQQLKLAQAQLQAAQANYQAAESAVRVMLYEVADEIGLSREEKQTCPFAQIQSGAWVFNCPPPKAKETAKAPEPVKPK